MAITDCRVWGVTEAEYDGVQLAGNYVVRFQVIADAVHGAKQLILLCQSFPTAAIDPARIPVPKKWASYDYRDALSNDTEVDRGSFAKRHEARLRDVESGFYNWWVDVVYERLEPGEVPPLDNQGDLIDDPVKWPIVYTLQTFTISRATDKGIPRDAAVRDKTIPGLGSDEQGEPQSFVDKFEDLPQADEVQSDIFVPITNQAGTPPSVYKRHNLARPLLVAKAYVRDLYTFYKDITRAKGTANAKLWFGQAPGYACFKDGRIVGGRRYEVGEDGLVVNQYYEVEYRWEMWGNVSDVSPSQYVTEGLMTAQENPDSKERPCAEVQVVNEGFYAWSAAAPDGSLQPISEQDTAGNDVLVTDPWPLDEDGTAKAAADADTYDVYGWWVLLPYDYTKMAGGRMGDQWPRYDYVNTPERKN